MLNMNKFCATDKNNIVHGNSKCDVVTLQYGQPCWLFM